MNAHVVLDVVLFFVFTINADFVEGKNQVEIDRVYKNNTLILF